MPWALRLKSTAIRVKAITSTPVSSMNPPLDPDLDHGEDEIYEELLPDLHFSTLPISSSEGATSSDRLGKVIEEILDNPIPGAFEEFPFIDNFFGDDLSMFAIFDPMGDSRVPELKGEHLPLAYGGSINHIVVLSEDTSLMSSRP